MKYRLIRTISGRGQEPGQFTEMLRGIAVDTDGRVFAVGDTAVRVFQADGSLLRTWSTSSPGYCIAVARNGHVYVGLAGQIEIYEGNGTLIGAWRDEQHLGLVTAIGFADTSVLAADANARCIRRLDPSGKLLNTIGDDNRRSGFLIPNGVIDFAVDRKGVIHTANPGCHRVERFAIDGTRLGHFGRFDGQDPSGFPGCCNPTNVAVDDRGRIFVTEKAGPRAKVYDSDGTLLSVVADSQFELACKNMDLAVDSQGQVYVVDTVKLQILVFAPQAEPVAAGNTAAPSEGDESR